MRLVMMTEPLIVASRAVCGCLEPPGVSSGCLAATLCTDPAIGRFFPLPCGRSGRKRSPRGLWPDVDGGDSSPETNRSTLRRSSTRVKSPSVAFSARVSARAMATNGDLENLECNRRLRVHSSGSKILPRIGNRDSIVAVRAKKPNRSKRVDSVRASRDGHQFHEAWVARCALGLLLPRFDLRAIAVEGLSEEDELGAPAAVVEIADATYYYGNGASFETCTRMEVAQFKYSISNADTPLRMADVRKTLAKFAATENEFVSKHGGDAVALKITYSINSNRPFAADMLEAFRAASTGQPAVAADVDAQLRQLRSVVKRSGDGLRRFASRVLLIGRMDSLEAIERGNARTVADWSVSNDALARARIGELRDIVQQESR